MQAFPDSASDRRIAVREAQAARFDVSATHDVGECVDCDAMRRALRWATRETCARMRDVACVAFATDSALFGADDDMAVG